MSKSESLTHSWLRQNLQPYATPDLVFAHVEALLSRHPTIRPKTDVYTYDDGRTQLLLCLHGLLPIAFRGAAYHIPIALWIPRDYPRNPPIAYVVPTADMLIRAGPDMDVSGRCLPHYLRNWERKSEGCSLTALLEAMQESFSREPPVYAKPKDAAPTTTSSRPSASSTPDYTHRPPPPLPGDRADSVRAHAQGSLSDGHPGGPPPLPAKTGLSAISNALSSSRASSAPLPNASPALRTQSPAPLNSVPSPPYVMSPRSQASPPPPFTPAFSPAAPAPAPPPSVPAPDLLDAEDDGASGGPSTSSFPAGAGAIAPPRPPNPELLRLHDRVHAKITSELASLSQAMALDAERLRANQTDLLAGQPAIRDEMARLEAVRDVCRGVAARLEGVVAAGERNVAELRRKGDPEVDEMICSTTIVHNQLLNLVAEDNAIEDTIYHLHRALNTGRIDLERFLRVTRVLAEEQFMKRALVEKIQAGLPMGDGGYPGSAEWR
ncbi:UEV domain-containing protein [Daedaleopsis nitida]|nr:UEV domain-containing protein [Daedaleopsis nitida]